jgi:ubiquinone/menaquinone biosynthesis C-methylase UbiE
MEPMKTNDHDATVRRSFNQQTALFTGEGAVFAGPRSTPLLSWLEPLPPDAIALEVACGAAHVAEQAAPSVRQVVGIDLTPALLRLAADRLSAAGITNVLLQEGNANRLPFLDASFDLVFCRASLHHFPDPRQPVAEMARVCRPGGRVVVSDMVAPDARLRGAFDELHRKLDPSHASAMLREELAALVRSTVGPADEQVSSSANLPIEAILTDAADRDSVLADLRAELDGGPATGFNPVLEDDRIQVSFTSVVMQAIRP